MFEYIPVLLNNSLDVRCLCTVLRAESNGIGAIIIGNPFISPRFVKLHRQAYWGIDMILCPVFKKGLFYEILFVTLLQKFIF